MNRIFTVFSETNKGESATVISFGIIKTQHAKFIWFIFAIVRNFLNVSLSEHINERAICNAVAPEKDVDGFHIVNIGKLCLDQRCMVPATAAAVWEIIRRTGQLSEN